MVNSKIQKYLDGKELYGDDFTIDEIRKWMDDEKEAYAELGAGNIEKYKYAYHALNYRYGFRFLPDKNYSHILGFGSAYGDELEPIQEKLNKITMVDPSDTFASRKINNIPVTYIKPEIDGSLPFTNNYFDLITCFGVLHHIPTVSKTVKEFYRCLEPGGYALVREPIISLGNWTKKRHGLTRRERGIPIDILRQIISSAGFKIFSEKKCMFPFTYRLKYLIKDSAFNSKTALLVDELLCWLFAWNYKYHAYNSSNKLRPTSVFYVLFKP